MSDLLPRPHHGGTLSTPGRGHHHLTRINVIPAAAAPAAAAATAGEDNAEERSCVKFVNSAELQTVISLLQLGHAPSPSIPPPAPGTRLAEGSHVQPCIGRVKFPAAHGDSLPNNNEASSPTSRPVTAGVRSDAPSSVTSHADQTAQKFAIIASTANSRRKCRRKTPPKKCAATVMPGNVNQPSVDRSICNLERSQQRHTDMKHASKQQQLPLNFCLPKQFNAANGKITPDAESAFKVLQNARTQSTGAAQPANQDTGIDINDNTNVNNNNTIAPPPQVVGDHLDLKSINQILLGRIQELISGNIQAEKKAEGVSSWRFPIGLLPVLGGAVSGGGSVVNEEEASSSSGSSDSGAGGGDSGAGGAGGSISSDSGAGGAGELHWVCWECGKRYSTSSNLARHKQTHRLVTDPAAARQCPHCDKVYVSVPAYAMHVRTHSQVCRCHLCGKCFSRPWLLQGHLRTHTGEKPFLCTHCGKPFADKSNLRAHVQTHSHTKPHSCLRCGKAFALKSYLYKHEESSCMRLHRHHPQPPPPLPQTQHSRSVDNQQQFIQMVLDRK